MIKKGLFFISLLFTFSSCTYPTPPNTEFLKFSLRGVEVDLSFKDISNLFGQGMIEKDIAYNCVEGVSVEKDDEFFFCFSTTSERIKKGFKEVGAGVSFSKNYTTKSWVEENKEYPDYIEQSWVKRTLELSCKRSGYSCYFHPEKIRPTIDFLGDPDRCKVIEVEKRYVTDVKEVTPNEDEWRSNITLKQPSCAEQQWEDPTLTYCGNYPSYPDYQAYRFNNSVFKEYWTRISKYVFVCSGFYR